MATTSMRRTGSLMVSMPSRRVFRSSRIPGHSVTSSRPCIPELLSALSCPMPGPARHSQHPHQAPLPYPRHFYYGSRWDPQVHPRPSRAGQLLPSFLASGSPQRNILPLRHDDRYPHGKGPNAFQATMTGHAKADRASSHGVYGEGLLSSFSVTSPMVTHWPLHLAY
jgi:hypothetical protein